jgi:hypothetical protein
VFNSLPILYAAGLDAKFFGKFSLRLDVPERADFPDLPSSQAATWTI